MQNLKQLYRLDCTSNVIRTFIDKLISDLCYFNFWVLDLIFCVVFMDVFIGFEFKISFNCSYRQDVVAIHYLTLKNSHYFLKSLQNKLASSFSDLVSRQVKFSYYIVVVGYQVSDVLCANVCDFIPSQVQLIYHVFVFQKFT